MKFDLKYNQATLERIRQYPEKMQKAAKGAMSLALNEARTHVYETGFGGRPHLISRRHEAGLRGSVYYKVEEASPLVRGLVGSGLIYARIQERGGIIRAKKAKYLRFQVGGRWAMKTQVTIPARPYIEPALIHAARRLRSGLFSLALEQAFK